MSGHSKWSTIKHKKARMDAARGKVFTKLIREITVAAKMGGGDEDMNPRLRTAAAAARAANMPADNIKRAIQKGTGELEGVEYLEITYEGYGPGGVAILLETLTDNKNRTAAAVRHAFTRYNGKLAEPNAVAWMFEKRGVVTIAREDVDEEILMMAALEAGADDLESEDDVFRVICQPERFSAVQKGLEGDYAFTSVELENQPKNTVQVAEKDAASLLKLMEALEDLDDTQKLTANFDIDDAILEKLAQ
ncbi:MAG: YebC/PmpR family DNA-binding transcriptional regulator [Candidatus Krumholzibacteriota bacterium]|nr:YebC/PmpR family DNA-binding transcriptional regulator [Candidatus Krumholzibacteriota bacterium]